MGTHSDKHYNTHRELTLLSHKDIQTHSDMRMINYVVMGYTSTLPPLVISYPNTLPQYTYLWN